MRWIINFLTNRTTKFKFGEDLSNDINIKRGVPQGAALCQILYSVYVNGTPTAQQTQTKLGLFVDDTVYWTSATTSKSNIKNLRKIAPKLSE